MSYKPEMPTINLEACNLTTDEMLIVRGIINSKTGQLRASKPKVERHIAGKNEWGSDVYKPDELQGKTAYLWRMVVFSVSPIGQHQCMPVMAELSWLSMICPGQMIEVSGAS